MRRLNWLLIGGLATTLSLGTGIAASIAGVKAVYLLPMTSGLDQYLANRLNGVFRVVTNPKLADAVLTDQIGPPFEEKLAELYPDPKAADAKNDDSMGNSKPPASNFGRGRGTIFLVDLKSRAVIWSGYQKRNGSAPEALDRTAGQIVEQIRKQQKPK